MFHWLMYLSKTQSRKNFLDEIRIDVYVVIDFLLVIISIFTPEKSYCLYFESE